MAKRVGFVPGFAELRGNISGKQDLLYPENNNKAFEAPLGKRSYATNYRPAVVISHVARTGKFHFAIRTRSAVKRTARSTMAMALLGGAGALYGALIMNADKKAAMEAIWEHDTRYATHRDKSFQKYWMEIIREMLKLKQQSYVRTVGGSITIYNPWVYEGEIDVTVSNEILVKFWNELAPDPIKFAIEGETGVAHDGNTFGVLIASGFNVLDLSTAEVGAKEYVKMGASWLKWRNNTESEDVSYYADSTQTVGTAEDDVFYFLVEDAPTAG